VIELDHSVGNLTAGTAAVDDLAAAFVAAGFAFSRRTGKKTRSFCTVNIFVGSEYFEF
jgi:hypothetical protein